MSVSPRNNLRKTRREMKALERWRLRQSMPEMNSIHRITVATLFFTIFFQHDVFEAIKRVIHRAFKK